MGLCAVGYRQRMRELSLGPDIPWGTWSWTFQDGSCWASMAFENGRMTPERMVGWAGLSMEIDKLPVVACFVDESWRRQGIGSSLVTSLLSTLRDTGKLSRRDTIFATTSRWPKFYELVEDCGMACKEWE